MNADDAFVAGALHESRRAAARRCRAAGGREQPRAAAARLRRRRSAISEKPMTSPSAASRASIRRHAGHRQDPGALRAGPGLAEAAAERRVHDLHDRVEVARMCRGSSRHLAVERASPSAASLTPRVGRPGIDGLGGSERRLSGRPRAFAAEGQASRASPQPRASTSCASARSDDRARRRRCSRCRAGARLRNSEVGSAASAVELLDEQLAMAADHRRRDVAVAPRAGGEQGERGHARKLARSSRSPGRARRQSRRGCR